MQKEKKQKGVPLFYWAFSFAIIAAIGAWAMPEEKTYSVKMTLDEWSRFSNEIGRAKDFLRASNIDLKYVYPCDSTLTAFQIKIANQINPVLQAEKKEDSTKIKPKQ